MVAMKLSVGALGGMVLGWCLVLAAGAGRGTWALSSSPDITLVGRGSPGSMLRSPRRGEQMARLEGLLLGRQRQGGGRGLSEYHHLSYAQIAAELDELALNYPDFIQLTTAQDTYQLPSPGTCKDLSDQDVPCLQHIVMVTNRATLPEPTRPEVFLSGALHGNERVGPLAVLAVIKLLVKAAACVRDQCHDSGLPVTDLEWLAGLVRDRVIYAMPMTNSIGYHQNTREENRIDPNRDFPYHQDPEWCMQTITARSLNELWRENLFQLALTFHGGMEAITYEWGSPNHDGGGNNDVSPDDTAQAQIAKVLSQYAGHFPGTRDYQYGRINKVVYSVSGGMEDWGYAASWDNQFSSPPPVTPCKPKTFSGYPEAKTVYNNVTHRAFNILVETSNDKIPPESALGNDELLFQPSGGGSGHVTRNVRLALNIIDMVQPYVSWVGVPMGGCPLTCSLEPPTLTLGPDHAGVAEVAWRVGGALTVDQTEVIWGPWSEVRRRMLMHDGDQEEEEGGCHLCRLGEHLASGSGGKAAGQSETQKGWSRWHQEDDDRWRRLNHEDEEPGPASGLSDPIFRASLNTTHLGLASGQDVFLVVRAIVDQDWAKNDEAHPAVSPQSHVVNARTNPDWYAETNGHVVKGRINWYSAPLRLTLGGGGAAPPASSPSSAPPPPEEPATTTTPAAAAAQGGDAATTSPSKKTTDETATTTSPPPATTSAAPPPPAASSGGTSSGGDKGGGQGATTSTKWESGAAASGGYPGQVVPPPPAPPTASSLFHGFAITVGLVLLGVVVVLVVKKLRPTDPITAAHRSSSSSSHHNSHQRYAPVRTSIEMTSSNGGHGSSSDAV